MDEIRKAVLEGYSKELGFVYRPGRLSEAELKLTERLYKEKYSKESWNMGREFIHLD